MGQRPLGDAPTIATERARRRFSTGLRVNVVMNNSSLSFEVIFPMSQRSMDCKVGELASRITLALHPGYMAAKAAKRLKIFVGTQTIIGGKSSAANNDRVA